LKFSRNLNKFSLLKVSEEGSRKNFTQITSGVDFQWKGEGGQDEKKIYETKSEKVIKMVTCRGGKTQYSIVIVMDVH
jgi:hypothetical protein